MGKLGAIVEKIRERRAVEGRPATVPGKFTPPDDAISRSWRFALSHPLFTLICAVALGCLAWLLADLAAKTAAIVSAGSGTTTGPTIAQNSTTGNGIASAHVRPVKLTPAASGEPTEADILADPMTEEPEPTGTLSGVVKFDGLAPVPRVSLLVDPETMGIGNVIVYLDQPAAALKIHPASQAPATFSIAGGTYIPHVLVARVGQDIVARNKDPVVRNVHTFPIRNDSVNVSIPPGFQAAWDYTKPERSPTKILSDTAPWMQAWILVVDHPWVAVTDKSGGFKIAGLSPGTYQFTLWHETPGYLQRKRAVKIDAERNSKLDIAIPAAQFGE